MRNLKNLKVVSLIMAMVVATVLLSGCAPKVKADESVRIMAKGMLTLDLSEFEKMDIKKEEQDKIKDTTLKAAKTQIKTMLMAMARVNISDDQAQKIIDKLYETQKKASVSAKLLSEEDKTAVVELSIVPFNNEKMQVDMNQIITAKIQGLSQAEMKKQASAIITEAYLEAMDKAELKQEPTVIKVQCKLNEKDNKWLPAEDAFSFGAKLGTIVWGMQPAK